MKVKITLAFSFLILSLHSFIRAQIPNCDASVPVFYIDFTNATTDSTVTTSSVSRSGHCCSSVPPELCVLFQITTGTNTAAVVFGFGAGCPLPNGSIMYQVDCGPYTHWTDTTVINNPGVHYLTYCKPGNFPCSYSITSIMPSSPTGLDEDEITNSTLAVNASGNYSLNLNLYHPSIFILNIFSADGKMISEKEYQLSAGKHGISLPTQHLPEGIYFVQLKSAENSVTKKLVV